MSNNSTRVRRSNRLLDVSLQLSIPLAMCGTLLFLTAVYVATLAWFGGDLLGEDSRGLQRLGLAVTGVYLLVSLAATFAVGVIVTQRVAGPVRVIQAAVAGMRVGDFDRRLALRQRDHMQDLAAEVTALREELSSERAARRGALDRLDAALTRGDLSQAREIAQSLVAELAPASAGAASPVRTRELRSAS
jgi:hypothetical protein